VGIVLAFAVGYLVGANAGHEGYEEVVESLRAVRASDEFNGLLTALRSHASASLRQLGDLIDEGSGDDAGPVRLLERVRTLMGRAGSTWPAS
jgi:hypothetical protein